MTTMNTTDQPRAVACIRFIRLAGPLAGQYCNFSTGESVKVTTKGNGLATVERTAWRNSLTICNVLYGVPEHLVCEITEDTPNDEMRDRSGSGTSQTHPTSKPQ